MQAVRVRSRTGFCRLHPSALGCCSASLSLSHLTLAGVKLKRRSLGLQIGLGRRALVSVTQFEAYSLQRVGRRCSPGPAAVLRGCARADQHEWKRSPSRSGNARQAAAATGRPGTISIPGSCSAQGATVLSLRVVVYLAKPPDLQRQAVRGETESEKRLCCGRLQEEGDRAERGLQQ